MESFESPKGVIWEAYGEEDYKTTVGGTEIYILRHSPANWKIASPKFGYTFQSGYYDFSASSREGAAEQAFNHCHLLASNLCDAFAEAARRGAGKL